MDIYVAIVFGVLMGYLLSRRFIPNGLRFKVKNSLEVALNVLVYLLIFLIGLRSAEVLSEFLNRGVESVVLVLLSSALPLIFSVVTALILVRGVND